MTGCGMMKIKSRSKKRASSPLKKISSIVKALAAKYRKAGKKIKIGQLGKEAGKIYRGEKKMSGLKISRKSYKKSKSRKSKKSRKSRKSRGRKSRKHTRSHSRSHSKSRSRSKSKKRSRSRKLSD